MEVGGINHIIEFTALEAKGLRFCISISLSHCLQAILAEKPGRGDSLFGSGKDSWGPFLRERNSYVQLSQPVVCWSPYSSLKLCALLPNSPFSHIILKWVWNQPWWEHLHHENQQKLQIMSSYTPTKSPLLNIYGHTPGQHSQQGRDGTLAGEGHLGYIVVTEDLPTNDFPTGLSVS